MYNFNPTNRLSIKEVIKEITRISNTENTSQKVGGKVDKVKK